MADRFYDSSEGEFVDFGTLEDWESRYEQKALRIEELEAKLEAALHNADEAEAYAWELEQRLAKAVRFVEHAVELGRWDLNPSFRDEMIDFTTKLKGQGDE